MVDENEGARIEGLQKEIKKQQTQLEWDKNRIAKLESELAAARSASMKNETEVKELKQKIDQVREKNEELKTQIGELEGKLVPTDELQTQLLEKKARIADDNQQIQELNDEIVSLATKLTKERIKFEEQISKIAEEQVKMDLTSEKKLFELKREKKLRQEDREEFKKLLAKKEGEKEKLTLEMTDLRGLQSDLKGTQTQIIMDFKEKDAKMENLQSLKEKQEKKLEKLQAEIDKQKMEIDKLKSKTKDQKVKRSKIDELESLLAKKEAEIETLMLRIADTEGLQAEVLVYFEEQEEKIKNLQFLNKQQKDEVETKRNEIEELRSTLVELRSTLEKKDSKVFENYILTLQTDVSNLQNQLAESERLRYEQQASVERFEALLAQVQTQIEEEEQIASTHIQMDSAQAPPEQSFVEVQSASSPEEALPAPSPEPEDSLLTPDSPKEALPAPSPEPEDTLLAPSPDPEDSLLIPDLPKEALPAPSPEPEDPLSQVFNLFDALTEKAQQGITAMQLASEMEQTRNAIVKRFKWHPVLFELAALARQLREYPEGAEPDADFLQFLIEKTEIWKNRLSS